VLLALLTAWYQKRQGYSFWPTFILALVGWFSLLMFIIATVGKNW